MALNGLYCADVPLRNFAIGHSGASIVLWIVMLLAFGWQHTSKWACLQSRDPF